MNADPFEHTERLAKLIVIKHDLLKQLHALAQRQVEVIASDEVDRLMTLLAEKQVLLNQLQRVEATLNPFRSENADARRWRSPEDRRRCQLVADRANALLAELMQLEKQAEGALVVSRDNTSRELQASTSAFAARQAYVGQPAAPHQSLDLMSET